MPRTPNVFLIGAPRSGLQTLAACLGDHPYVFACTTCEPHIWSTDLRLLSSSQNTSDMNRYQKLFRDASSHHQHIVEISSHYLHSEVALTNILKQSPQAHFIAILRNPIEVAQEFHQDCLAAGIETETNFEVAWQMQEARAAGRYLPEYCVFPELLQYGRITRYGAQIRKLFQIAPAKQRRVFLFEDFHSNVQRTYRQCQEFLNLPNFKATSFPPIRIEPSAVHPSKSGRDQIVQIQPGKTINTWLHKIGFTNAPSSDSVKFTRVFHNELCKYYQADIIELSGLVNRDLTYWVRPSSEDDDPGRFKKMPALR